MSRRSYQGRRKHTRRGEGGHHPFYPNQVLRIVMAVMASVAAIALLAGFFPLPLDRIADPLGGPDPSSPPLWVLKPALLLDRILTFPGLTMSLITALMALFFLLPVLDPSSHRSPLVRVLVSAPILLWILFLAIALFLPGGGIP